VVATGSQPAEFSSPKLPDESDLPALMLSKPPKLSVTRSRHPLLQEKAPVKKLKNSSSLVAVLGLTHHAIVINVLLRQNQAK